MCLTDSNTNLQNLLSHLFKILSKIKFVIYKEIYIKIIFLYDTNTKTNQFTFDIWRI